MTKKALLAGIGVLVLAGAAFFLWKIQDSRIKAAQLESEILKGLSEEEINLVLTNQSLTEPSRTLTIVNSPETRQVFLRGMREYLALAARARREGLADDPNFKRNSEFKKNMFLARLYQNKLDNDLKKFYEIPAEQMEAVWKSPENQKRFSDDMQALYAVQKNVAETTGNPAAAKKEEDVKNSPQAREMWAKTKILSDMAKADTEFMQQNQRVLELQYKILEAGILSSDYLHKYFAEKINPTEGEINAYLAAHSEYDLNKKREKAELILQRARNGENLAALATEFSEDRLTKKEGGLFDEEKKGEMWAEVRRAAFQLKEGEIASQLIESNIGWHVVQLVQKRTIRENGVESVRLSVRHVLFQKRFEDPLNKNPDIPPPFVSASDIAKAQVRLEKRNKLVEEIVARENISLPEDFNFELTEDLKMIKENRREIKEKLANEKQDLDKTTEK